MYRLQLDPTRIYAPEIAGNFRFAPSNLSKPIIGTITRIRCRYPDIASALQPLAPTLRLISIPSKNPGTSIDSDTRTVNGTKINEIRYQITKKDVLNMYHET